MKARILWVTGALCCCSGGALLGQESEVGEETKVAEEAPVGPAVNSLAPVATPLSKSLVWRPMTVADRIDWYLDRTTGRTALIRGAAVAGWATLRDHPKEWNQDADGFAGRMTARMARITVANSVQLGLGFAFKDDPRYYRAPEKGIGGRLANAFVSSFTVRNSTGGLMPAYSRFAGIGVSNVVAKTWAPPSQSTWSDVGIRSGAQLGGQVGFNLLREFWPDIKRKFKK
jgi:hypothetical protein